MAVGRMIVNAITSDKRINELSSDTSRLAFTWLITFADREGRTHGDPGVVRSLLFPRRDDITIQMMTQFITEWAECGMIVWYETKDDQWIQFVNFGKNQTGLRKNREPESRIPAFEPEVCRNIAGILPDDIPVKLKEIKLKETGNGKDELMGEIFQSFESNIQLITPTIAEMLGEIIDEYPRDWILDAIKISAENNKRNLGYIKGILKRKAIDGPGPLVNNGDVPAEVWS